jgi:hypothetical protein
MFDTISRISNAAANVASAATSWRIYRHFFFYPKNLTC